MRIGSFDFVPPAGRWVAERVAAGLPLDRARGPLAGLVASVAVAEGDGLRVCHVTRVAWETPGGVADPRENCLWLQPFSFVAGASAPASAQAVADGLAASARAIEDDYVGEPDFWRGVKFVRGRGEAQVTRIGPNDWVDLHLVARDAPGQMLRSGGRALLLLAPHGAHLAAWRDRGVRQEGGEIWRVLESLRPAAP